MLPIDGGKDSDRTREVRVQSLLPSHQRGRLAEDRHLRVLYVLVHCT